MLGQQNRLSEAVDRYVRLADALRSFPRMQTIASAGITAAGEAELGLIYADRAIEVETEEYPNVGAWLARGAALEALGRSTDAIDALVRAEVAAVELVERPVPERGQRAVRGELRVKQPQRGGVLEVWVEFEDELA